MKAPQQQNNRPQRRDEDLYDSGNGRRRPVGNDLFNTNRRFDSDYANFDSAHAADYQRHQDFSDEYNNIREGYYRNRGQQTGNSQPSEYPDAYGNRYGADGEYSSNTHYNDERNRQQASGGRQNSGVSGYGDSGYRSNSDQPGYGSGSGYNQGGMNSYGADPDRYGSNSSYSNMGGSMASHRGKGPKSYVRSDERIHEDVSDRLRDDEHIDASDIEVSVEKGDVVLSGTVENRFAKRHAEDLTEHISGVRNVENRIRVKS
jgi:osmotically-inducible protein OsmY